MRNSQIFAIVFVGCCLSGCMSSLIVGEPDPAVSSNEVVIYFVERPSCNFETIAHIKAEAGYFTLASMMEGMRQEAARVGASGLYVLHTQQTPVREYLGTAKAIRCLPA